MRTLVSKTYRGSASGVGLVVVIVEQLLQLVFSESSLLRALTDKVHQCAERQAGLAYIQQLQAHQSLQLPALVRRGGFEDTCSLCIDVDGNRFGRHSCQSLIDVPMHLYHTLSMPYRHEAHTPAMGLAGAESGTLGRCGRPRAGSPPQRAGAGEVPVKAGATAGSAAR